MKTFQQKRRSFLRNVGLGISQVLPNAIIEAQSTVAQGYVLGPNDGEHLIHFRDGGNIFIKMGAATGSSGLALGTQQVLTGRYTDSPALKDG